MCALGFHLESRNRQCHYYGTLGLKGWSQIDPILILLSRQWGNLKADDKSLLFFFLSQVLIS